MSIFNEVATVIETGICPNKCQLNSKLNFEDITHLHNKIVNEQFIDNFNSRGYEIDLMGIDLDISVDSGNCSGDSNILSLHWSKFIFKYNDKIYHISEENYITKFKEVHYCTESLPVAYKLAQYYMSTINKMIFEYIKNPLSDISFIINEQDIRNY